MSIFLLLLLSELVAFDFHKYIIMFSQIIYGGLPDENKPEEEEILSRRTRGRKINYQEEIASDSEEVINTILRAKRT